ncbi:glycosyl hydrolase family 43 [Verrucomicrobia bacterium S94]|nr:glycosyl hydrolase family 43 [Verrucomicrobia bacterium S94]
MTSATANKINTKPEVESEFCRNLTGVGRILEDPDYNVWGCSPIYGPEGKVHVFYSRWKNEADHEGWLTCCEIAHAIADDPAGPYTTVDVALAPRGGDWWDAGSCHNPTIHKVGDKYVLFYLGVSDGTVYTKRVGMATADSLDGPWERSPEPIIQPDPDPKAWNSMCTTNPAFLQVSDDELRLYYKTWCIADWERDIELANELGSWTGENTNRQYGLTIAKSLDGPWVKQGDGPMINLKYVGENAQSEDAYIWMEDGLIKMIMRDMGYWNHEYGLYFESEDGVNWSDPQIAYRNSHEYFDEEANGLDREGRFERPQLLMGEDGHPEYLFCAFRGGKYNTSSGVVLKIG